MSAYCAVGDRVARVEDRAHREDDVGGGERRSVVPFHPAMQVQDDRSAVGGDAVIGDRRHGDREVGHELARTIVAQERVEGEVGEIPVDDGLQQQRLQRMRIVVDGEPERAAWRVVGTRGLRTFRMDGRRDEQRQHHVERGPPVHQGAHGRFVPWLPVRSAWFLEHVGKGQQNARPQMIGETMSTSEDNRKLREWQRVEGGLRLLSRTGAAVVDSLDFQRTLRNIARAFVDGFAAYCLIDVMPESGRWERTAEHRDPSFIPLLTTLSRPTGSHPIARAIDDGIPTLTTIDDRWARELNDPLRGQAVRELRVRSIICVPVKTPAGEIVGALTCALDDVTERDDYGPDDLGFVEEVARRAGAALANLRLYERERRIAVEFQAASLPARLPNVPAVTFDADYRPASDEARIGGDWYDAFILDGDRLGLTVGDVLGHGLHAAVLMTKLRLAMQSAARVDPDPCVMLRVAEETLGHANPDGYATAFAAIYEPASRRLTYASAGHPRPVMLEGDGTLTELCSSGTMLGVHSGDDPIASDAVVVQPGATLVVFTDGLVEVTRDHVAGITRLRAALAGGRALAAEHPAAALVTTVVGSDEPHDDIAVLVATFA
jgi:hypothetical protein